MKKINMMIDFDSRLESKRLMRKVEKAIDRYLEQDHAEIQVAISELSADQLEALAQEFESSFSRRLGFRPYARVFRNNSGQVKAISFFPGWLDFLNYGKEIRVLTHSLRYAEYRHQ